MSEPIVTVIPAQPGSFAVVIWDDGTAHVLPIAAWITMVEYRETGWYSNTIPLVSDSTAVDPPGGLENLDIYRAEWKAFMPGENALAWAKKWEEESGRAIAAWDLSNWWPSKSPVFVTADDTLWSDGLAPPDEGDPDANPARRSPM